MSHIIHNLSLTPIEDEAGETEFVWNAVLHTCQDIPIRGIYDPSSLEVTGGRQITVILTNESSEGKDRWCFRSNIRIGEFLDERGIWGKIKKLQA